MVNVVVRRLPQQGFESGTGQRHGWRQPIRHASYLREAVERLLRQLAVASFVMHGAETVVGIPGLVLSLVVLCFDFPNPLLF